METNLQIFDNEKFGEIRGIMIDGEPYFVGKDVASALGYVNPRKALIDHVDEEDKTDGVTIRDSIGREQKPILINESGLYSLILASKLPKAKEFKRWVTSEVLPSIRKTGAYKIPQVEIKPSGMVREIRAMSDELQATFGVQKGISLIKVRVVKNRNLRSQRTMQGKYHGQEIEGVKTACRKSAFSNLEKIVP